MPSQSTTPGQPTGLTAQMNDAGALALGCDPTPLATRFRFRKRIVGVEDKFSLAASSPTPMAILKDVVPGQTLELIVQAVNGNQQGVASEPIQFTIPPVVKATRGGVTETVTAVDKGPALETSVSTSNGANGHANGSRLPALS